MNTANLTSLLTLLLGGGALATFTALFKGLKALRDGRKARENETVDDLRHWMDTWEGQYRDAERDLTYYRIVVGKYLFQMRSAGLTPDPDVPMPPSERGAPDE